jgi:hypothetical protein
MRTTLDIDDVLKAAKDLARPEHKTAGRILSDLARRGRGTIVSNEMIDRLREEDVD